MSAAGGGVPTNAEVVMDRFVSATSVEDALGSLRDILEGFRKSRKPDSATPPADEEPLRWEASWIWQHEEMPEHLVHLLHHGELKTNKVVLDDVDEGTTVVLQLYEEFLANDPGALTKPGPGRLLEALLDVLDGTIPGGESSSGATKGRSAYSRVLALRVLEKLSKKHPSLANDQWLQAPNGLHRLADTLTLHWDNPAEEPVRNQALQVARLLARSPPMAKVFLFAELESKLLDMGWHLYGGLTKGNPIVLDLLDLVHQLAQHTDASLQDLVWQQRPSFGPRLAQLLDLRGGHEFLHPNEPRQRAKRKPQTSSSSSSSQNKPALGPLSRIGQNDDDDDDDLDDLLNAGSSGSKPSTAPQATPSPGEPAPGAEDAKRDDGDDDLPQLLPSEEQVVAKVLDILDLMLDSESVRPLVWKQHGGLCSLVWELALINPSRPPVCALPSKASRLQQHALELVARKFNDPSTMDRHRGLDRLLYLVCTGGGSAMGASLEDRLGISQAALSVLRSVLDKERIHTILLHTLAPPPTPEGEDDNPNNPVDTTTVVQKLWNTAAENMALLESQLENDSSGATVPQSQKDNQVLFVSGALGGLSVFLADAESREMVFKVTPPSATIDHMLDLLASQVEADSSGPHADVFLWSMHRFLCEYVFETPRLVQTLLSSSSSTHLASLLRAKRDTRPLLYLLLGLAMEFFPTDSTECGGWTPSSILELLQSTGISKVTKALEQLKKAPHANATPWAISSMEAKHWNQWYQNAVWRVRKRIVQELAGGSAEDDEDDDDEAAPSDPRGTIAGTPAKSSLPHATSSSSLGSGHGTPGTPGIKPLQKLIAHQTSELEELRQELEQAQAKIAAQDHQLETWQKRMQSTPTELDGMLSEFTTKTATLEEEIAGLQNAAKRTKEQHEQQATQWSKDLEEERDESARLREAEQEAREDRDRMEQELQALSQAYSSLEEEYRRSSSVPATTAAAAEGSAEHAPSGAAPPTPQQQPEGESSASQTTATPGSTEVSTLKADNERLRKDARAADEWMSMAVQRMNEMGAHVGKLQQALATSEQKGQAAANEETQGLRHQIATLQQQIQASMQQEQGLSEQISTLQSELARAQEQSVNLQDETKRLQEGSAHQEARLREQLSSLQEQIAQEKQQTQVLRDQMAGAQESVQTAVDNARKEWNTIQEVLQAEKKELQEQLSQAREQAPANDATLPVASEVEGSADPSLLAKLAELQRELASKSSEIESLKGLLEATKHAQAPAPLTPPRRDSLAPEAVEEQLASAQKELEGVRHRSQEDIYKKEAIIRELEDRLSSGLGAYKIDDIRERDEEIEELRVANEAAQEWMAKAVEHHQLLQKQVAALTDEKSKLSMQLSNVQAEPADSSKDNAIALFENEIERKTSELERLQGVLTAREAELRGLREDYEQSQAAQQTMSIAKDDAQILQKQLEDSQLRVKNLEAKLEDNALYKENEELIEANKDLEGRIEEFQSWADMAQKKISEIMTAKEQGEKTLAEFKELIVAKDLEIQNLKSATGQENAEDVIDPATRDSLKIEMDALESTNQGLVNLNKSLEMKFSELESKHQELQAWTDGAQQRIFDVVSEKEKLEHEVSELKFQLKEASSTKETVTSSTAQGAEAFFGAGSEDEVDQRTTVELKEELLRKEEELRVAQSTLAGDEDAVQQWEERVAELEAEIDSLRTESQQQEEEANSAISQWQESYAEAENKCKELEAELNNLKEIQNEVSSVGVEKSVPSASAEDFFGESNEVIDDTKRTIEELTKKLLMKEEELRVAEAAPAGDEDAIQEWEARVEELEAEIDELRSNCQQQEEDANAVIAQWRDSHALAEKKCINLEAELNKLNSQRDVPTSDASDDRTKSSVAENFFDGESASSSPENQTIQELSMQLKTKEEELLAAQATLASDEEAVQQWEARVEELEAEIDNLRAEAVQQEEDANIAISQWQESYTEADNKCTELETELDQIRKANSGIAVEQADHSSSGEIDQIKSKLKETNEALAAANDAVKQWEERAMELQTEVDSLTAQIQEETSKMEATKIEMEGKSESFDKLEIDLKSALEEKTRISEQLELISNQASEFSLRVEELEENLTAVREDKAFLEEQFAEHDVTENELSAKIEELEETLAAVQEDKNFLEEQFADHEATETAMQARISELEAALPTEDQRKQNEVEIEELRETVSRDEEARENFEAQIHDLEQSVQVLRVQLKQQSDVAGDSMDQWQQTYNELENKFAAQQQELTQNAAILGDRDSRIEQLESELASQRNSMDSSDRSEAEKSKLINDLALERDRNFEARDEISSLSRSLEETEASLREIQQESEDVMNQWTERVDELETQVSELMEQLTQQEEDANQAIASWEAKAEDLESDLDAVSEDLSKAQINVESEKKASNRIKEKLNEVTEKFEKQEVILQELQGKLEEVEAELDVASAERNRLKDIQASKSREKLEEERDRLTVVITELEEELNEANNMVQKYITERSSDRATEAAAQALRDEIDELKNQIDEYRLTSENERYKREIAEQEIERMRDDITALASLNEHENPTNDIQQRTAKAVERMKMKERIEIVQLRKTLYRSIEELEIARAAEKEANEKLAKVRLETAVTEQEIISSKSEINFLTEAMEEIRMSEENKRASLEYRIGSLEDENDVLRKYHSSELESVRNELAQVGMEKDRIISQLKEIEKTNASLVLASSKTETKVKENAGDLESEISKLRIENAHLLTVASDDKARAERRLREVLAAHRATAEADTILEHELRIAAEATVLSLQAQLEELRNSERREGASKELRSRQAADDEISKLNKEIEKLQQNLQKSIREQASLKEKMEQSSNEAKVEIAALTDECRQAQAKAHKLERENRFDEAVKSEVSRLQMSPEKRNPQDNDSFLIKSQGLLFHDDPVSDRVEPPMLSAEAFDLVRRQKEEIQEERKMYLEFLAEHDDLLALLAQHDLERACLKDALSESAGNDVLEDVMRQVEEKALAQFGNIIRVG